VPQGVKVQVFSFAQSLNYGTSRDLTLTLKKLKIRLNEKNRGLNHNFL